MIVNANSKNLTEITGTLPNMAGTLSDWFQPITFVVIKKETINFQLVEKQYPITFKGVVESVSPKTLDQSSIGQRIWDRINVWTLPNSGLTVDDRFQYGAKYFRIIKMNDWMQYGYQEFECVEDYQ